MPGSCHTVSKITWGALGPLHAHKHDLSRAVGQADDLFTQWAAEPDDPALVVQPRADHLDQVTEQDRLQPDTGCGPVVKTGLCTPSWLTGDDLYADLVGYWVRTVVPESLAGARPSGAA